MAQIGELFGVKVTSMSHECRVKHASLKGEQDSVPGEWQERHCPFTDRTCDVTANRADRAFLDLTGRGGLVTPEEKSLIIKQYGKQEIPLGICSLMTRRQNEELARPWIVCPKRLMELRSATPTIHPELRSHLPIKLGTKVRCWWEVKFRNRDEESSNFFEYTFDYLIIPYDEGPIGPPYIIEIMTSSTRGGGLTEHMVDALLLRDQRKLRSVVKSPYTPNYRQVFERMLGQLYAKSEIAEKWGGRAVWLVQDVLVDYIEHTTDFRPAEFEKQEEGNVFVLVFKLAETDRRFDLVLDRTLRGFSRPRGGKPDFSRMLGLGFAPKVEDLYEVLKQGERRGSTNWIDFFW